MFASLLRMATKYGFSDVREALVEDLKGAYPTKLEDFRAARVLGEDVFGSPKPHPNAVLNLFVAQNVRFAIPFASYRASLGGFLALMSDEPGTVLPRHTLACTVHGMGLTQRMRPVTAYTIGYVTNLLVCTERGCLLDVGAINDGEQRAEVMMKISDVMLGEREGGLLSIPSLEHLTCAKCAKALLAPYTTHSITCWDILPAVFGVAKSWDEV